MYKNPKTGSITFIGAFIFFFFSFFLVQCNGSSKDDKDVKKITGIELATGSIMNTMNKYSVSSGTLSGYVESPTSIWAFVALLCILTGIPTAILYNKKSAYFSFWIGVVGTISLIILPIHLYYRLHGKINMDFVHFEFGYFATLGCLILATYFCYKRYNEIFNEKKI